MIDRIVGELATELYNQKAVLGRMVKVGPIEEVDGKKGYRVKLGENDGEPVLSPWYPHPESGGDAKSWLPLSKGEIVTILSVPGAQGQGQIIRGGFGGVFEAPTEDLAIAMLQAAGVNVKLEGGKLTVDGDILVNGDVDFAGGHVKHNSVDIGDDHKHKDVMPGTGNSGPPVS